MFSVSERKPAPTTVPVLAKNKTITGRLWTYVRDDRPFAGPAPPAALFHYSRDRGGEHPRRHLEDYAGILQADTYAGFNDLYDPGRRPGPITEAACWAHSRRKFYVLADVAKAPIAVEAVRRIDLLFDIERTINGSSPEQPARRPPALELASGGQRRSRRSLTVRGARQTVTLLEAKIALLEARGPGPLAQPRRRR